MFKINRSKCKVIYFFHQNKYYLTFYLFFSKIYENRIKNFSSCLSSKNLKTKTEFSNLVST